MSAALAVCEVCAHTSLHTCRLPRCRLCGGPLARHEAPEDPAAWRCGCASCALTPC